MAFKLTFSTLILASIVLGIWFFAHPDTQDTIPEDLQGPCNDPDYFCANLAQCENKTIEHKIRREHVSVIGVELDMYVHRGKDLVSYFISKRGTWEADELWSMNNALSKAMVARNIVDPSTVTFVDIGAHVGWYGLPLAAKGFSVVLIEPFRENVYILKRNRCINPKRSNIVIIDKALGEKENKCQMRAIKANIANPVLECETLPPNKDTVTTSAIEVIRLDTLAPLLKNVLMIKMDIEGFEYRALQGGKKVLLEMHVPYIFSEFSTIMLSEQGSDAKKYLEEFMDAGYTVSLSDFGKDPKTIGEVLEYNKINPVINIYFTYNGST